MNIKEHRIKMIKQIRWDLCMMSFFFLINLCGTILIIENYGFLFWFNLICFIGTVCFVILLDFYSDKIIEGRL